MCCPPSRLSAPLVAIITLAAIGCSDESRPPTGPAEPEASPTVSGLVTAAAASPLQFSQISAGGRFTCGITTDGRAFCWGINFFGQLGDGANRQRQRPSPRRAHQPPLPPDHYRFLPHLRRDH